MTGHREQPKVQQQHTQPQNNHFTFTGSVFLSTLLALIIVALNSSGATRDTSPLGNSHSNRLLKPNLKQKKGNVSEQRPDKMLTYTLKENQKFMKHKYVLVL